LRPAKVNRANGTLNVVGGTRSIPGLKTGVTMPGVPAGTGFGSGIKNMRKEL